MMNLGDFTTSETIYVPFTTYNSSNASVTITGLATTDIEIYKNGSVTQRSSDAGYALLDTDGIDFDSTTGLHGFSVDLSDNTDAGFYAAGSQYWLVVNAITVDAQTVVFCYYFTIGRYLKPTTAGRTLDIQSTGEADVNLTLVGGSAVVAASGVLTVNPTQIGGSAAAATRLALSAAHMVPGTIDTGSFAATTTQFEADDITEATADHYNGRSIIFTTGALADQATAITDYALVGANGRFTVTALTESPANNDTFVIV